MEGMNDIRPVAMSREQAVILEAVGVQMLRDQDERAIKLLALSLAYKFAKPTEPTLPDNVVEFGSYSKRVPCA